MCKWSVLLGLLLFCGAAFAADEETVKQTPSQVLQSASVTVKTDNSEGSGTIISRELQLEKGSKETVIVNFILTAAHVVDDLRSVRTIIKESGAEAKVIEFKDASIVKEYKQNGRRVGETKMDCKIVAYSDADHGEDLALLMVRSFEFEPLGVSIEFKTDIVDIGSDLLHCGSLLGQMGANSMTKGIMSQQGRVYNQKVFDQTTVPAFPGSSGGGVYVVEDGKPLYVGMITRGAGETFNLMVPTRRIEKWAKEYNIPWLLDPKADMPSLEEIEELPVEKHRGGSVPMASRMEEETIFLDGEHANQCWWSQHYNKGTETVILEVPLK